MKYAKEELSSKALPRTPQDTTALGANSDRGAAGGGTGVTIVDSDKGTLLAVAGDYHIAKMSASSSPHLVADAPPTAGVARMSKDSDLPPIPSTSAQRERPALGTGLFKKFTTKLRSPTSSPTIPSPSAAPTPANSPNIGSLPSPSSAPAKPKRKLNLHMQLPKPAGLPPADSFTSLEHRQAALRERGLIPAVPAPYRNARGYMIPLSEQEKVLDQKFAKEVELHKAGEEEGDSEAKQIRQAWLRRNRESEDGGGGGTGEGSERVKMSESEETSNGNVTFGQLSLSRGTYVPGTPSPVSPSFAILDTAQSALPPSDITDPGTSSSSSSPHRDAHPVFVSPRAPPLLSDIHVLTHTPSQSLTASPKRGKGADVNAGDKVVQWLQTSSPTGTPSPKSLPIPVSGSAPLEPPESESLERVHPILHLDTQVERTQQPQQDALSRSASTGRKRRPAPITVFTPPSAYSLPPSFPPPNHPLPSLPVPGRHPESAVDIERRQSAVSRLSKNVPSLTNTAGTGSEPSVSLLTPTTTVSLYPPSSSDGYSREHGQDSPNARGHASGHANVERLQSTIAKPMLLGRDATVIVESIEAEIEDRRGLRLEFPVKSVPKSLAGATLQVDSEEKLPMRKSRSFSLFGRKSSKGELTVNRPTRPLTSMSSMSNMRRVTDTLSSKFRSKSSVAVSPQFADLVPPLPPLPLQGIGLAVMMRTSSAPSTPALPAVARMPGSASAPLWAVGGGRIRQAVSPTIYSRGDILLETRTIEDAESRRLCEMAFLA